MMDNLIKEVIDERKRVYGDPAETFPRVAQMWSALIGTEIRPDQVPLMLSAYKLMRASITPDYSDNIDDADGYNNIFRTVVGNEMIHARSVDDYLQQKQARNGLRCDVCNHVKPADQMRSIDGQSLICTDCEMTAARQHKLHQLGSSDMFVCANPSCTWSGRGDAEIVRALFDDAHGSASATSSPEG